jgi:hypothetical protein
MRQRRLWQERRDGVQVHRLAQPRQQRGQQQRLQQRRLRQRTKPQDLDHLLLMQPHACAHACVARAEATICLPRAGA